MSPTMMPTLCDLDSTRDYTLGKDIIPTDAFDYLELFDFYDYCITNEAIEWKRGITDGTLTTNELASNSTEIDYNLFFCLFGIYKDGYILMNSSNGEVLDTDSGVTIGGGIDLAGFDRDDLSSSSTSGSGINISSSILDLFDPYFRLRGEEALDALCEYGGLELGLNTSYLVTLEIVEHICLESVSSRYDEVAIANGVDYNNNTSAWDNSTRGVKTVLTVMYCIHGNDLYDYLFWQEMIDEDYEAAIISLSTWTSLLGYTDKELYQYLANILAASVECTASVDIVLLIDGSQSVSDQNFRRMKKFIKRIVRSYAGESGVRFGLSQFSTTYQTEFYLNRFIEDDNSTNNNYTIYDAIDNVEKQNGLTRLATAMEQLASDQFNETSGMRSSSLYVPRVAIIITDGLSSDGVDREALDRKGVSIIAIGVGDFDLSQLEEIGDSVYEIGGFNDLTTIISDITGDSCLASNELDDDDGESDDIDIPPFHCHYYHFNRKKGKKRRHGGHGHGHDDRFHLQVNQGKGCVYVYLSVCDEYPSYYNHILSHKVCGQKEKKIVINAIDNETYYDYCNSSMEYTTLRRSLSRNLLQDSDDSEDGSTVYITIEGIDTDSNYTIELDECLSNETECEEIGSNEDSDINSYSTCSFDSQSYDSNEYIEEKDECESKTNERDCVGYFDFCLWGEVLITNNNNDDNNDNNNDNNNNNDDSLDGGIIAVIVISCLISVGIIIFGVIFFVRQKKENKESGIATASAEIVNATKKKQTNILRQKSTDK